MLEAMRFDALKQQYSSASGKVMKREEGLTPNGNQIARRWVLRGTDGTFVDVDQYRFDLAERNGLTLRGSNHG